MQNLQIVITDQKYKLINVFPKQIWDSKMKTSSIYMLQELSPQEHVQFHCAEQHCLDTLVTFFEKKKTVKSVGPESSYFFL